MSDDLKLVQHQIKTGEPYLFVRGDHPLAVKMAVHWAALNSVDRSVPADECTKAALLADAMKSWKGKK
jgi:hypothetical protein